MVFFRRKSTIIKIFITIFVTASFQLLVLSSTATAQSLRQDKLENVRQDIVFPEMTSYQKQLMAEQAEIFIEDLYVHRFDKLSFYSYLSDPVPAVNEVVRNVDTLSSAELEQELYRIFISQRDLHLNYIFPPPHGIYRSGLPLTFTRTASEENFFEVRINSVSRSQFEQFAPGQRIPEVGDRVIGYNKLSMRDAVQEKLRLAQGANRFGGFSRALGHMTFIPHLLHLVPEEDEVEIVLMSSEGGADQYASMYSITVPWITQWREPSNSPQGGPQSAEDAGQVSAVLEETGTSKKILLQGLHQGADSWQKLFNDFIVENNLQARSAYPSNPSNEPRLTWGLIDNPFGQFGYLNLSSFIPVTGIDFTINEIKRVVTEEFQNTQGLIFDVRNNGGGNIILADSLPQLFSRNQAKVHKARLLNTDLNRRLMNDSLFSLFLDPEWARVANEAKGTGNTHTEAVAFTSDEEANSLGQVYYKPVAVLANANSYSATDLFTCAMQDNEAAIFYGEDPKTGAGGANVITHNLFNIVYPIVFKELPLEHRMRVSWRQSLRFGENQGKIIEDFGCSADEDVSKTGRDVVSGNEDQILKITQSLAELAQDDDYEASVRPMNNNHQLFMEAGASYDLFVKNTEYIDVVINGELVDQVFAYDTEEEMHIPIQLPQDLETGVVHTVVFKGKDDEFNDDGEEETLWNLKRQIIIAEGKVVLGAEGFEINFAEALSIEPLMILNYGNAAEDGWQFVPPNLQVGYNPRYANNVNTDAVLLMDLSNRTVDHWNRIRVRVALAYETEEDYDFIEVYVTDSVGNRVSGLRSSGSKGLNIYSFDISEFAGQDNVALHVNFTSDGGVTAPGVRLRRLLVR